MQHMPRFFREGLLASCGRDDGEDSVSGADIWARSLALADQLKMRAPPNRVFGVYVENSLDWAVLDLALAAANLIAVPIPEFFTPEQKAHLLRSQSISAVVANSNRLKDLNLTGGPSLEELPSKGGLVLWTDKAYRPECFHRAWSGKLTFTSGSTGAPKPVALAQEQLWAVAHSLAQEFQAIGIKRHLCMLPLSILLENVAGLYTAFLMGAECIFAKPDRTGLVGSSRFDARAALKTISDLRAHSLILLPEMLKAIVEFGEAFGMPEHDLKLVAVGGGKLSSELIHRAHTLGIPVYEGYGLSEAASVVSVNLPSAKRVGSVGKPLSHLTVRLANDNEIIVCTRARDPMTGENTELEIASGDLGQVDQEGYLFVLGRKKNLLITGFGRNVSPEWPEATLTSFPVVAQAFVFGDGQPALSALLVPVGPHIPDRELASAVFRANKTLPDYAQITSWRRCLAPFSARNGRMTSTGKLRREAILHWMSNAPLDIHEPSMGGSSHDVVLSEPG